MHDNEVIRKVINAIDPLCCVRTDVQIIKLLDVIDYWKLKEQVDKFNNTTLEDIIHRLKHN